MHTKLKFRKKAGLNKPKNQRGSSFGRNFIISEKDRIGRLKTLFENSLKKAVSNNLLSEFEADDLNYILNDYMLNSGNSIISAYIESGEDDIFNDDL